MNLIPIKKETKIIDGIEQEVYIIPAMTIGSASGSQKKVPHPIGGDCIILSTLEEAQALVARSGYDYVAPNNIKSSKKEYANNYSALIFEALTNLSKDSNPNVVASAISSLAEILNPMSLDLFIEKMGEDNDTIRTSAIEAITKFGGIALPKLMQALQDSNWVKRNSAIISIGNISNSNPKEVAKTIVLLLDCLKDSNSIIRATAAQTLGKIYKVLKEKN